MFLVRRAAEVMDTDIVVAPADTSVETLLVRPDNHGRLRHVVVTRSGRIHGVLRVNTSLRPATAGPSASVALGDIASREFTVVREGDIAFDVIRRMWRPGAIMALVVGRGRRAVPDQVPDVITKEHVADSFATSISV